MGTIAGYFGFVVLMSIVSCAAYGVDKRQAIHQRRRIPEQTLHAIDLLGGWPGGLAGQRLFRHKTRKLSFQIVFWITVVLNLIVTFVAGRSMLTMINN